MPAGGPPPAPRDLALSATVLAVRALDRLDAFGALDNERHAAACTWLDGQLEQLLARGEALAADSCGLQGPAEARVGSTD